jgi:hypothetical protein
VSSAVWSLEWRLATTRKRVFILNVMVPLTLVLPVATGAVPPVAAAGVYVVMFAAFAVFGSALPLRVDGQRGMSARVVRAGVAPSSYLVQRAAAGAALDTLQLTPALLLAALTAGAGPAQVGSALLSLAGTVWVWGFVGVIIAATSRSITETALFAAVTVPLLAHMSGVFRTSAPNTTSALLEGISPLRALHEDLLEMIVGVPSAGEVSLLIWAILLPMLVWLLGSRLVSALDRQTRGGLEGA